MITDQVSKWKVSHFTLSQHSSAIALWKLCGLTIYPEDSKAGIKELLNHGGLFLTCCDEGKLIATLMAGYDGRRAFLYHLAVHPDFQHQGIASQMVAAMELLLHEKGAKHFLALVDSVNQPSKGLFSKKEYSINANYVLASKVKP